VSFVLRLWDVRNLKEAVKVLKGRIGAVRSLRFSGDGRHLAMAEPADFVHVFETGKDYGRSQEIDLFGEVRTSVVSIFMSYTKLCLVREFLHWLYKLAPRHCTSI
jgi:hypothetical protein